MYVRFVFAMCAMLAAPSACKSYPYVWVKDAPVDADVQKIFAGDTLSVNVKNQTQLSGDFLVRANGAYLQPLVGEIAVEGLTAEEVHKKLLTSLNGIVNDPAVTVSVSTPRTLRISVVGEVHTQGNVQVPYGEGVLGAISRAGGLTEYADGDSIFVLREKPKRIRIRFTFKDLTRGDEKSDSFRLRDGDIVVVE